MFVIQKNLLPCLGFDSRARESTPLGRLRRDNEHRDHWGSKQLPHIV